MRPCHVGKVVLVVLCSSFAAALASAVTPDPRIISLVPPTAGTVAGTHAPHQSGQPSSLLLTTHNNLIDLNDFMALSGVDSSRVMEQVIMVALDRNGVPYADHGLIASGRFNQTLIEKSVHQAGANPTSYRGTSVMEVQPLARERDTLHDVRWLVMVDSNLALFGTIPIVKEELDRYLAHSATDPSLERRLARLRRDDDTWCLAKLLDNNSEIQSFFEILDSKLAELLGTGDTVQFGVHYGRRVEFEYEVDVTSGNGPQSGSRARMQSLLTAEETEERGGFPAAVWSRSDNGVRGALKISRKQYETWMAQVMASRAHLRAASDTASR